MPREKEVLETSVRTALLHCGDQNSAAGRIKDHSQSLLPAVKRARTHNPFPEREVEMDGLWLLLLV